MLKSHSSFKCLIHWLYKWLRHRAIETFQSIAMAHLFIVLVNLNNNLVLPHFNKLKLDTDRLICVALGRLHESLLKLADSDRAVLMCTLMAGLVP